MNSDRKRKLLKFLTTIVIFLGLASLVFYIGYRDGHITVTEELREEYREKISREFDKTEKEVERIKRRCNKDVAHSQKPLKKIEARYEELMKRKKKANEIMSMQAFIGSQGQEEFGEDVMMIKQAYIDVGVLCKRIRLIHDTFEKKQFISSTVRNSSKIMDEIFEAHKKIMEDMTYYHETTTTLEDLTR